MEPFKILKDRFKPALDNPENNLILHNLSDSLRCSILNIFNMEAQHPFPSLIDIYKTDDYSVTEGGKLF